MSTTKLITMICWIVVAVVLIGLVVWFLTGSLFGFGTGFKPGFPTFNIGSFDNLTGPYNAVGSYTIENSDINSLDVTWVSGAATVTPYDGSVIKITEYARRELKDNEKLVYNVSGNRLEVKYCSPGLTFNMLSKKLELLVPKAMADKLSLLSVNATSAEVKVSDFKVSQFDIQETSGTADISNIKADTAGVRSVSGEILITNLTAQQLTTGTVSGEIRLSAVTADALKSNTTSGEQQLGGAFKAVDAGSVSGGISVASSVNPDRMTCGTTSGGIVVTIPGSGDLTVSYSTTSGHFSSDIPVRTGGSAPYRFTTVSGEIRLKAAA